jgi:hypothetical protein
MAEPDDQYFARRAVEERQAAQDATDPRAADIHAELAGRYDAMAIAAAEHRFVADAVAEYLAVR